MVAFDEAVLLERVRSRFKEQKTRLAGHPFNNILTKTAVAPHELSFDTKEALVTLRKKRAEGNKILILKVTIFCGSVIG